MELAIEQRLQLIEEEIGVNPYEKALKSRAESLARLHSYYEVDKVDGSVAYIGFEGDITSEVIRKMENSFDWYEFHQDKGQFVVGVNHD